MSTSGPSRRTGRAVDHAAYRVETPTASLSRGLTAAAGPLWLRPWGRAVRHEGLFSRKVTERVLFGITRSTRLDDAILDNPKMCSTPGGITAIGSGDGDHRGVRRHVPAPVGITAITIQLAHHTVLIVLSVLNAGRHHRHRHDRARIPVPDLSLALNASRHALLA